MLHGRHRGGPQELLAGHVRDDGTPVARYHLEMAWPSKLEVGGLKAGASEVLMETVTLVCEHIQRVAP